MVDMLILKNDKVKIIIEIEESDIIPVHICGKLLASALSSWYIYKRAPYPMDDSVSFVQVIKIPKPEGNTSKPKQCENIAKSINNILPIKGSKIKRYKLFTDVNINKIVDFIVAEYNS